MVIPCGNKMMSILFIKISGEEGGGENSSGTWNSKPSSRLGIHTSTSMYTPVEGFLIAEFFRELAITSVKKFKTLHSFLFSNHSFPLSLFDFNVVTFSRENPRN
jgi:hypothetical protein